MVSDTFSAFPHEPSSFIQTQAEDSSARYVLNKGLQPAFTPKFNSNAHIFDNVIS